MTRLLALGLLLACGSRSGLPVATRPADAGRTLFCACVLC